jgi:hypothetical protein
MIKKDMMLVWTSFLNRRHWLIMLQSSYPFTNAFDVQINNSYSAACDMFLKHLGCNSSSNSCNSSCLERNENGVIVGSFL